MLSPPPAPRGTQQDAAASPDRARRRRVGRAGGGAQKSAASFLPGRLEEGMETRLPRAGPPVVHEPGERGAPLPPEPVLRGRAWRCLPERGCVRPKPLQHLCIRMCSSLSSLLACALPRSLPTTTPVPGEGIFFLFFFFLCLYLTCHSPRTSQRGRATRSIMHNSWPASAAVAAAPGSGRNPSPAPIASGSPRPWGRSRCGASGLSSPMSGGWEQKKGTCLNGDAQPCAA